MNYDKAVIKRMTDWVNEGLDNSEFTSDLGALINMAKQAQKLQAFKDYTHQTLTDMGVPENPNPDKVERTGCRIETRLRWLAHKAGLSIAPDQKEFVEWLEAHGLYNPYESAQTMRRMYAVWRTAKEVMEVLQEDWEKANAKVKQKKQPADTTEDPDETLSLIDTLMTEVPCQGWVWNRLQRIKNTISEAGPQSLEDKFQK